MNGVVTAKRTELAAALGWWTMAGVDTVVGDAPFAWLADAGPVVPDVVAAPVAFAAPRPAEGIAINADSLSALAAALAEIDPRAAALFADGTPGDIMVIGDRPTAADAAAGRVFADAAGLLLDRMLLAIGRGRDTAYLANLVAWPGDRAPTPADLAATAPYLRRQIQLARPRAILALGQAAAAALTGSTLGINRLRGRWHDAVDGLGVPVMPTFAPAHLLLHPTHKALAWSDLCAFRARLDG